VLARDDRGPALLLRRGGFRERRGEPGPHGGREGRENGVLGDGVEASQRVSRRVCGVEHGVSPVSPLSYPSVS
jgi:hypothetical protein